MGQGRLRGLLFDAARKEELPFGSANRMSSFILLEYECYSLGKTPMYAYVGLCNDWHRHLVILQNASQDSLILQCRQMCAG